MASAPPPVAVVTGGNRGLGLETARQLAGQGFRVVLTSRDPIEGQRAVARLAVDGFAAESLALDVTDEDAIDAFARTAAAFGPISALVHNAGVALKGFDAAVARQTLAVNFYGPRRLTAALDAQLVAGSRVVLVSSGMGELSCLHPPARQWLSDPALSEEALVALMERFVADVAEGHHGAAGWPSSAYRVSKAGLNAYTRLLAERLRPRGVLVNAVCPGWVRTRLGGWEASRGVEEGAWGIAWAASLPPDGPTGGFFRDGEAISW